MAMDGMVKATGDEDSQPKRILIVDDVSSESAIVGYLGEHGMRAVQVSARHEVVRQVVGGVPSLVILDLQRDHESGLDLLRDIRSRSDVPVIITAGVRCDEMDRVAGLELGADDYVGRPFSLRELVARIRAVLRHRPAASIVAAPPPRGCRFGGWRLDRGARRLTNPEGAAVALTKSQYALLLAFLDAPGRPLSREYLMNATRMHEDVFDRSIDVQVLRLRRKLETDRAAPRVIRTERGVGYVFALPVEHG